MTMRNLHHPSTAEIVAALSVPDDGPDAWSRRRFLQMAAASGAVAATPAILKPRTAGAQEDLGAVAAAPPTIIAICLAGGNDGLNTVVPYESGRYRDLRGSLALGANRVLPVGGGFAFNNRLSNLKWLWDNNRVGVVHGVGNPGNRLSHFDEMAVWMAGHSSGMNPGSGWLGRYMDGLGLGADDIPAITIGTSVPLIVRGNTRSASALPRAMEWTFGTRRTDLHDVRRINAVKAMSGGDENGRWGRTWADTMSYSADLAFRMKPLFPTQQQDGFAYDCDLAARLVNADLGVRVVHLLLGGFDTHDDQQADHDRLLTELDQGIAAIYGRLDASHRPSTTIMVWTEFGRRTNANGSRGTDHGTANELFLIGDRVRPGFHGQYPSLTALDDHDNLVPTVDFRSVYASVLDQFLGADSRQVIGASYGGLSLFTAASQPPVDGVPTVPGLSPAPRGGSTPGPAGAGGYWLATSDGAVHAFGDVAHLGEPSVGTAIVAIESTPTRKGYWLCTAEGKVLAYGDAVHHGDLTGTRLNAPIVDMVRSPKGGYWLLGRDGGVFAFGGAPFFGSTGSLRLNRPVVGMAAHPSGDGYWFVASDGGIFAYGPAGAFHGSMGGRPLNKPVVAMAPEPGGNGYWLCASDGGIFAFGPGAQFHGSTGSIPLAAPIVGLAATASSRGYWFVASDGGIFAYGDAPFSGSLGGRGLTVVGMAA
jgi:uncharacterized protein (DUF1501 family)